MSKYTTELRFICENYKGYDENKDYTDVETIITDETVRRKIFGSYPIFDEQYRTTLESKILRHYYTREISEESVGLWKLRINAKMNEIMPYYNQYYRSELLEFNPFYDIDLSTTHSKNENGERNTNEEKSQMGQNKRVYDGNETSKLNGESIGTENKNGNVISDINKIGNINTNKENTKAGKRDTETTGGTTNKHVDKYSDTPQGSIENIENDTYLTNARIINNNDISIGKEGVKEDETENETNKTNEVGNESVKEESKNVQTNVSSNNEAIEKSNGGSETQNSANIGANKANEDFKTTEAYLENVQGKRGLTSYSELLNKYRETFLNIDMKIINELSQLFFNLW